MYIGITVPDADSFYDLDYVVKSDGVPHCSCGGVIKPDVVLYEEGLDDKTLKKSVDYIRHADILIIGGTSWWCILRQD